MPFAFTLIELLVVISIIALLAAILMPSLAAAREHGRSAKCLGNLHALAGAAAQYHANNNDTYWPYYADTSYFWGTPTVPVDTSKSAFLKYVDYDLRALQCPSLAWGTYVPQGGVVEPTTTYGYNAWCFDPGMWGRKDAAGNKMTAKKTTEVSGEVFVFADSAMYWAPSGVPILQNSTSLDPVTLGPWGPNHTPTTQFRHRDRVNALCPDGSASGFGLEGGVIIQAQYKLGFCGARNAPHYDVE